MAATGRPSPRTCRRDATSQRFASCVRSRARINRWRAVKVRPTLSGTKFPLKENSMRSVMLFVAGLSVGVAVQAVVAQGGNKGVVMMNHVGINVPNIPDAVTYYTQKMGYKEAFRVTDDKGQPTLVYLQISKTTFLELNQATAERAPGFTHYGLHVENAAAAVKMFKDRGVKAPATN